MNVKIFISYKWQDSVRNAWVEKLYKDLRQRGVDAKLDKYEVAPGQSFSDYMTRGVRESNYVLFVITPQAVEAVESGYGALAFEMQIANARRMSTHKGGFSIIPIFREGIATSAYLTDHRYLDFRVDEEYNSRLNELIQWVTGKINPPTLGQPLDLDDIYTLDENGAEVEALLKRSGRMRILTWCYEDPDLPTTHVQKGKQGKVNSLSYTRSLMSQVWDDCPHNRSLMIWDLQYDKVQGVTAIARRNYLGGAIDRQGWYAGPQTPENIENLLKRAGTFKVTGYSKTEDPYNSSTWIKDGERGAIELSNKQLLNFTRAADGFDFETPGLWNYYVWDLAWQESEGIVVTKRHSISED